MDNDMFMGKNNGLFPQTSDYLCEQRVIHGNELLSTGTNNVCGNKAILTNI